MFSGEPNGGWFPFDKSSVAWLCFLGRNFPQSAFWRNFKEYSNFHLVNLTYLYNLPSHLFYHKTGTFVNLPSGEIEKSKTKVTTLLTLRSSKKMGLFITNTRHFGLGVGHLQTADYLGQQFQGNLVSLYSCLKHIFT